jgi:Ca2+-binding RTX toxin-like protein
VQGTPQADRIYVWTSHTGQAFAWLNGQMSGPHRLSPGGHVKVFAGAGNDQVYATDSKLPVQIFGEAGHDQITGGSADDLLDGGDGDDTLSGSDGRDVLIGGLGRDHIDGGAGEDLLIGGATTFDTNELALLALLAEWRGSGDFATRTSSLAASLRFGETVLDDGVADCLSGGDQADWLFQLANDCQHYLTPVDLVAR